jgi:hypothetical protein
MFCLLCVSFIFLSLSVAAFLTNVTADDEHCIQHPEHEFSISTSKARAYAY